MRVAVALDMEVLLPRLGPVLVRHNAHFEFGQDARPGQRFAGDEDDVSADRCRAGTYARIAEGPGEGCGP